MSHTRGNDLASEHQDGSPSPSKPPQQEETPNTVRQQQMLIILSNYSDDLHALKKRDGLLPAQAAIKALEALINQSNKRVAVEARNELVEKVHQHLKKIEAQEGGGMLDLMAVAGTLEHDEDNAFKRDRLVSERRAVYLISSIAADLTKGEQL